MTQTQTYKIKFQEIAEWMPLIMEETKKDLKNEHLRKDPAFVKAYFSHNNLPKITTEELSQGYLKAFQNEENPEALGDFITSRWLMKNSEIYDFFEIKLSHINPDFASIEQLNETQSKEIIEESTKKFGALKTFLFAVLNSVVFDSASFKQLKEHARKQEYQHKEEQQLQQEKTSFESLKLSHSLEISRLTDKYEKKLSGLQKKYAVDVEALKKQVASLQRKLNS